MIIQGVDVVIGLKIYQVVAFYEVFEVLIFLREVSSSSHFFLKGGDEVEVSSEDIKVVSLLLPEPLQIVEKVNLLIRPLQYIDIGYTTTDIGTYEMERG